MTGTRGGDLRGNWGDGPSQNLRWRVRPCIRPPNILRSSARKYEQSKKDVFLVRKGSYTTFNIVKTWKIWEKKGKMGKPGR